MAIYNIYVKKRSYEGHEFGNRYLVEADDLASANAASSAIVARERDFHFTSVTFLYVRTSDTAPNTDVFTTTPLDGTGFRTAATQLLPSILTVNVKIGVAGGGRPSRKFYHVGAGEGEQDASKWAPSYLTLVKGDLEGMIADVQTYDVLLVDPQGSPWAAVVAQEQVGTHQWSKRSKRRAT